MAADFAGTADFAGRAAIMKLSGLRWAAENVYLLVFACGFKFPLMSVITDPAFALAGNTALLLEHFRGCETC